ncbi:hypothetical protein RRG08_044050 [Elysia crispata]|uniref:Uncharacterized protein n=1 Tax=Elysia crispata TaxID=231223 RepID=A0AAE1CQV6_9GAST|nr:hypothetical protein RRG08_044050 [Elysia crispata]
MRIIQWMINRGTFGSKEYKSTARFMSVYLRSRLLHRTHRNCRVVGRAERSSMADYSELCGHPVTQWGRLQRVMWSHCNPVGPITASYVVTL